MVRLKTALFILLLCSYKFQFHNGSIKDHMDQGTDDDAELFQFHNGSIKDRPTLSGESPFMVSIPQWFD